MEQVCVLGGLRSFIGVKDGIYKNVPAETLGAEVLKNILEMYQLKKEDINLVIGGNAVAGGGNITRLAVLEAGFPESIPAMTIDCQCGSALQSILTGAAMIETGVAELVIAGGLESSSTQPLRVWNKNHPDHKENEAYTVAKFIPGMQGEQVMLEGAELTALTEDITKEEMDPWIIRSHQKAAEAAKQGVLKERILSINGSKADEGIRGRMNQRLLDRVPYVLPNGKVITAANACFMNDGAAFVILASKDYAARNGYKAEAYIKDGVITGSDPMQSPKSAVTAIHKILERADLSHQEIGAYEVNEAFAVIDALVMRAFPGIEEQYNRFGGALAYGHPYGASGAVLLLHLIESLRRSDGKLGICSVAAAGGIGSALLLEKGEGLCKK